ncbi:hypothetical protein EJ110_NYTH54831 [Nymphaea thermarum]|nr:hypothetical protein EJ110_NYTH54831 [Nymphaea thermarum]
MRFPVPMKLIFVLLSLVLVFQPALARPGGAGSLHLDQAGYISNDSFHRLQAAPNTKAENHKEDGTPTKTRLLFRWMAFQAAQGSGQLSQASRIETTRLLSRMRVVLAMQAGDGELRVFDILTEIQRCEDWHLAGSSPSH